MARRKVVVTGAAGYVARRMLPAFRERYDLVLLDITNRNRDGQEVEGIVPCDLSDRNRDNYRHHFRGADAVVHCAFVRPDKPENRFWAELENVVMAYNIYQVCVEEGVRRAVVCSSNHAADYYERLLWSGRWDGTVAPDMLPLSDNFYGWAKAAYELLGFVFATGSVTDGKQLEVVQVRIGAPREPDFDRYEPGDWKRIHRALGAYLSARDQVQLFVKAIETENIRDEYGVPFLIVYGISGNTLRFWSIDSAVKKLGYQPEDDALIKFATKVAELLGVKTS